MVKASKYSLNEFSFYLDIIKIHKSSKMTKCQTSISSKCVHLIFGIFVFLREVFELINSMLVVVVVVVDSHTIIVHKKGIFEIKSEQNVPTESFIYKRATFLYLNQVSGICMACDIILFLWLPPPLTPPHNTPHLPKQSLLYPYDHSLVCGILLT